MRAVLVALLLMAVGLAGCSGSEGRDGDHDGLNDPEEKQGWDILVDLVGAREYRHVETDPNKRDTDGDGLTDLEEFQGLWDASRADTDGDGLTDCQEVKHTVREQCEDADYNGPFDGGYRTDARNADSDHGPSRYVNTQPFDDRTGTISTTITQGDGISDGDEVLGYEITLPGGGTKTVTSDPLSTDTDDDLLEDGEEVLLFGSDPTVVDSDGDGCMDGKDPFPDRVERYDLGLQSFTLRQGDDLTPGAQVRFAVFFGSNDLWFAPASGTISFSPGQQKDVSGADGTPRPLECDDDRTRALVTPYLPDLFIQVTATDVDGSSDSILDIASETGGADGLYWNVREDTVSFTRDGPPISLPIRLAGDNGVLLFRPRVT